MAQLWPLLFRRYGLEIAFAHRTFAWGYEGEVADRRLLRQAGLPREFTTSAAVHVVILGLTAREAEPASKRLFSYPDIKGDPVETTHPALTAYLFDAGQVADRHRVVEEVSRPINGARRMIIGSKPIDGGWLMFDATERERLLGDEPQTAPFLRPYVGAQEYLNGGDRWILALQAAPPEVIRQCPTVLERVAAVRAYREGRSPARSDPDAAKETVLEGGLYKRGVSSLALAVTPTLYHVNVVPDRPFLAIPEVSSERRDYVPIGWLEPPVIPSNKLRFVPDATLVEFAILTSRMHMAWTGHVGGRLKSDYQYSIGINYNTFPWPRLGPREGEVQRLAQAVLDARAAHPGATLADLYDPDVMPADLRRAHQALDRAVDRLYRAQPFSDDRARVEYLFGLYERMTAPVEAAARPARRRRGG